MSEFRTGTRLGRASPGPGPPADPGRRPCAVRTGLDGHSDADVLAHAITDALLGAAGARRHRQHFPDSDPRWKGADSLQFIGAPANWSRKRAIPW